MNTKNIPYELIDNLYWAAVIFRDFIEMNPIESPVLWCGDRKSRVIDMPHFKYSCEYIREYESFINGKAMDTSKPSETCFQPNNILSFIADVTIKPRN